MIIINFQMKFINHIKRKTNTRRSLLSLKRQVLFYEHEADSETRQILDDKYLSDLEKQFLADVFNKQYNVALDHIENGLSYIEKCNFYNKDQVNLKTITLIVEMKKFMYGDKLTRIE